MRIVLLVAAGVVAVFAISLIGGPRPAAPVPLVEPLAPPAPPVPTATAVALPEHAQPPFVDHVVEVVDLDGFLSTAAATEPPPAGALVVPAGPVGGETASGMNEPQQAPRGN